LIRKYILADVAIVGDISFNSQTVVTSLVQGQEIVWCEEISAIKKNLSLFDEIYVNKVQNDIHDLNIVELPKLNQVKFVGLKKTKTEV
jgi:outer membrane protein insertion porin family